MNRIAIVVNGGFSGRWIAYCERNGIDYKIVDPYASNIVQQVADCTAFMWHHSHVDYRDTLFAKQLLYSLEQTGKRVFPDYRTTWHFDDKVGQKYLMEALGLPMVPSHVFYTKREALTWVEGAEFPKVFKLRGGSGAASVSLVKTRKQARRMVRKAFGRGFPQFDRMNHFKEHLIRARQGKESLVAAWLKGCWRMVELPLHARMRSPEKGYCYFQEFMPGNQYDIRVCVVNHRAFAIKRMTRKGDFRASGSGDIVYGRKEIDERCVEIAFEAACKLGTQCVGIDFVFDEERKPLMVEISFAFTPEGYDACDGYWEEDMTFVEGTHFDFCGWMVESVVEK